MRWQLERKCVICGAEAKRPCRVLGVDPAEPELKEGDPRPWPHFYR
jgi:hypothetical protein